MMVSNFKALNGVFKGRKLRNVNYVVSGLFVIYIGLIIYPNFLFGYSFRYQNLNVYSTHPLSNNILAVLREAETKLLSSEIYSRDKVHPIYLCNNYGLYTFFAPFSRKAFACNYPFSGRIFIASCDVDKNEAYKNDENDQYTRPLSTLISHEVSHTSIRERIGFWKYKMLNSWKNEGYCDYVGYGGSGDMNEAKAFLIKSKDDHKPGTEYRKYYFAVNYLVTREKMTFDQIISSDLSLEAVLNKVRSAE